MSLRQRMLAGSFVLHLLALLNLGKIMREICWEKESHCFDCLVCFEKRSYKTGFLGDCVLHFVFGCSITIPFKGSRSFLRVCSNLPTSAVDVHATSKSLWTFRTSLQRRWHVKLNWNFVCRELLFGFSATFSLLSKKSVSNVCVSRASLEFLRQISSAFCHLCTSCIACCFPQTVSIFTADVKWNHLGNFVSVLANLVPNDLVLSEALFSWRTGTTQEDQQAVVSLSETWYL
mgnify:CR=1 FL=1